MLGFVDLKAWDRTELSIRWENRASRRRVVVQAVWGESMMSLDSLRRWRSGVEIVGGGRGEGIGCVDGFRGSVSMPGSDVGEDDELDSELESRGRIPDSCKT